MLVSEFLNVNSFLQAGQAVDRDGCLFVSRKFKPGVRRFSSKLSLGFLLCRVFVFIHGRNLIFADENILRQFTFVFEFPKHS